MAQKNYEYKSKTCRTSDLDKFLNNHAKDRWKLLLVKGNIYIFERELTKPLGRPKKRN